MGPTKIVLVTVLYLFVQNGRAHSSEDREEMFHPKDIFIIDGTQYTLAVLLEQLEREADPITVEIDGQTLTIADYLQLQVKSGEISLIQNGRKLSLEMLSELLNGEKIVHITPTIISVDDEVFSVGEVIAKRGDLKGRFSVSYANQREEIFEDGVVIDAARFIKAAFPDGNSEEVLRDGKFFNNFQLNLVRMRNAKHLYEFNNKVESTQNGANYVTIYKFLQPLIGVDNFVIKYGGGAYTVRDFLSKYRDGFEGLMRIYFMDVEITLDEIAELVKTRAVNAHDLYAYLYNLRRNGNVFIKIAGRTYTVEKFLAAYPHGFPQDTEIHVYHSNEEINFDQLDAMPAYEKPKTKSRDLYAYLKTLKHKRVRNVFLKIGKTVYTIEDFFAAYPNGVPKNVQIHVYSMENNGSDELVFEGSDGASSSQEDYFDEDELLRLMRKKSRKQSRKSFKSPRVKQYARQPKSSSLEESYEDSVEKTSTGELLEMPTQRLVTTSSGDSIETPYTTTAFRVTSAAPTSTTTSPTTTSLHTSSAEVVPSTIRHDYETETTQEAVPDDGVEDYTLSGELSSTPARLDETDKKRPIVVSEKTLLKVIYNGVVYTLRDVVKALVVANAPDIKILHNSHEYTPREFYKKFSGGNMPCDLSFYKNGEYIDMDDITNVVDLDILTKIHENVVNEDDLEKQLLLIARRHPNARVLYGGRAYTIEQFLKKYAGKLPRNFRVKTGKRVLQSHELYTYFNLANGDLDGSPEEVDGVSRSEDEGDLMRGEYLPNGESDFDGSDEYDMLRGKLHRLLNKHADSTSEENYDSASDEIYDLLSKEVDDLLSSSESDEDDDSLMKKYSLLIKEIETLLSREIHYLQNVHGTNARYSKSYGLKNTQRNYKKRLAFLKKLQRLRDILKKFGKRTKNNDKTKTFPFWTKRTEKNLSKKHKTPNGYYQPASQEPNSEGSDSSEYKHPKTSLKVPKHSIESHEEMLSSEESGEHQPNAFSYDIPKERQNQPEYPQSSEMLYDSQPDSDSGELKPTQGTGTWAVGVPLYNQPGYSTESGGKSSNGIPMQYQRHQGPNSGMVSGEYEDSNSAYHTDSESASSEEVPPYSNGVPLKYNQPVESSEETSSGEDSLAYRFRPSAFHNGIPAKYRDSSSGTVSGEYPSFADSRSASDSGMISNEYPLPEGYQYSNGIPVGYGKTGQRIPNYSEEQLSGEPKMVSNGVPSAYRPSNMGGFSQEPNSGMVSGEYGHGPSTEDPDFDSNEYPLPQGNQYSNGIPMGMPQGNQYSNGIPMRMPQGNSNGIPRNSPNELQLIPSSQPVVFKPNGCSSEDLLNYLAENNPYSIDVLYKEKTYEPRAFLEQMKNADPREIRFIGQNKEIQLDDAVKAFHLREFSGENLQFWPDVYFKGNVYTILDFMKILASLNTDCLGVRYRGVDYKPAEFLALFGGDLPDDFEVLIFGLAPNHKLILELIFDTVFNRGNNSSTVMFNGGKSGRTTIKSNGRSLLDYGKSLFGGKMFSGGKSPKNGQTRGRSIWKSSHGKSKRNYFSGPGKLSVKNKQKTLKPYSKSPNKRKTLLTNMLSGLQ